MAQFNEKLKGSVRSDILFQDDLYTFLECTNGECVKYYAPYGISRRIFALWDDDRDSQVFFITNKNFGKTIPHVDTIVVQGNGFIRAFDDTTEITINELIQNYPSEIAQKLNEKFQTNDTYEALQRIANGFEYDKYQLRRIDDSIDSVTFNKGNPAKSMIRLTFDTKEYLQIFYDKGNDDYYDDVDFIMMFIGRGYSDYQFNDYSQAQQDWEEGYLIRNFNQQNMSMFDKIGQFIMPSIFSKDTEEGRVALCERLQSSFRREVENIIDSYNDLDEQARRDGIVEDVQSSFSNKFERFGIYNPSGEGFKNFVTTVQILINLYDKYKMKGFSITQLLRTIVSKHNMWGDSYQENSYDYYGTFDNEEFNREVSRNLDTILEKMEDSDFFYDIEGYKKLLEIGSKYSINKWHSIPHTPHKKFMIQDFDEKTNTMVVLVNNTKTYKTDKRRYNVDQFNNFLHSPELFEQFFG